jgi:prepilin-type N-terminal cleavage/methylation domain-containing protein
LTFYVISAKLVALLNYMKTMKTTNKTPAFTLIELLVVISIIAVLASIALPVFTSVQERGFQTKDLSNAKQIALACKLYAGDHDGLFPNMDGQAADPPVTALTSADTSNQAFACLIPAYLPTEKLFYLAKSAWSTLVPDEDTSTPAKRCEASSNNFAYELGLNEVSNPSFPLIADAPKTGNQDAVYSTVPSDKGGVWKGKKAVVIRCDQSGTVETALINATTSTIVGPTGGAAKADIFVPDATTGWLVGNALLLPK